MLDASSELSKPRGLFSIDSQFVCNFSEALKNIVLLVSYTPSFLRQERLFRASQVKNQPFPNDLCPAAENDFDAYEADAKPL